MSTTNQISASVSDVEGTLGAVSPAPTLQGDHAPKSSHHIPEQSHSQKSYNTGDGELLATTDNADVLIVDWDGPDDPQNPKNWSYRRKWAATIIISSFTFISPVSSSMIAPATGQVASAFGIDNDVMLALATSIFVLAYAMGPLFLGPLSEIYGRSRVLQLANLWYLVWNLVCGFAQSESQLLVFRFLAGLGGSAPLSIGGGFLGDCWQPDQRGRAVAIYSLAPLMGTVLNTRPGDGCSGLRALWMQSFKSLECLHFKRLERKAERIRRSMDAEKAPYREIRTVFEGQDRSWQAIMAKSLSRPFVLFAHEPIVQLLGVYMAYLYGTLYLFLTTMPSIFQGTYHQSVGISGLHYAALGLGLSAASQLNARTMDKVYIYLKGKNGGVAKPEFRLPAMVPGSLLLPIGCLIVGWTSEAHTFWIAPDIGIALVGAGIILNFQCIQTYIVDCFTLHAASALAAISCLRSLAGFGFPLFAPAMYKALGFGKGDTILAVVAIVVGCPAPWILWRYGERIRNSSRHAR
ncbi:MFS polyamine transporter [Suillus variegatus]|nr:MFS polyamine transporter [Suillus variegatus]